MHSSWRNKNGVKQSGGGKFKQLWLKINLFSTQIKWNLIYCEQVLNTVICAWNHCKANDSMHSTNNDRRWAVLFPPISKKKKFISISKMYLFFWLLNHQFSTFFQHYWYEQQQTFFYHLSNKHYINQELKKNFFKKKQIYMNDVKKFLQNWGISTILVNLINKREKKPSGINSSKRQPILNNRKVFNFNFNFSDYVYIFLMQLKILILF